MTKQLRRKLREAPATMIADLPEDVMGRITGTVRAYEGAVIEAPLTGRRCVYAYVELRERLGESAGAFETILGARGTGRSFIVERDGHRVVVDPDRATVTLQCDQDVESSPDTRAPRELALLTDPDLVRRPFFRTSLLRFREATLEVGDEVTVIGAGPREPDPDAALPTNGAYRGAAQTRLRFGGSALIITDDPSTV